MKILFWVLAILLIPVYLFGSFAFYLSQIAPFTGELAVAGNVVTYAGMGIAIVGIAGIVVGIGCFRKGKVKRAFLLVLIGLLYGGIVYAAYQRLGELHAQRVEDRIEGHLDAIYGEGWDGESAIEGLPEAYENVLSKFYVAVTERWPAEELIDLGAVSMSAYYGDTAEESIGFALADLNGDDVDELVIGTVAPVEEGGTAIFCVYTDPTNPFYAINSVEGDVYYMHPGDAEGGCRVEIAESGAFWVVQPAESENSFAFDYAEGAADPAARLTLDMIPFSQFK